MTDKKNPDKILCFREKNIKLRDCGRSKDFKQITLKEKHLFPPSKHFVPRSEIEKAIKEELEETKRELFDKEYHGMPIGKFVYAIQRTTFKCFRNRLLPKTEGKE